MTIKLKVYNCKYSKREKLENWIFKGDLDKCKIISNTLHKRFTDMADFVDKNKLKFKDKVMFVRASGTKGLSKFVKYDGVFVYVEDRGFV